MGKRGRAGGEPTPTGPREWNPDGSSQKVRDAGHELLRYLLTLYSECRLTALDLTTICFYLTEANVGGASFSSYALDPKKATGGNPMQKIDNMLPTIGDYLILDAPINYMGGTSRTLAKIPMRSLWGSLSAECESDPSIFKSLDLPKSDRPASIMDVPAYDQHPCVVKAREAGERQPIPVAIYLDGVTFQEFGIEGG